MRLHIALVKRKKLACDCCCFCAFDVYFVVIQPSWCDCLHLFAFDLKWRESADRVGVGVACFGECQTWNFAVLFLHTPTEWAEPLLTYPKTLGSSETTNEGLFLSPLLAEANHVTLKHVT